MSVISDNIVGLRYHGRFDRGVIFKAKKEFSKGILYVCIYNNIKGENDLGESILENWSVF